MKNLQIVAASCLAAALVLWSVKVLAERGQAVPDSRVDAIFARWNTSTPGCAVGVSSDDKLVLARGYGMADLEHDAPIAADTIFEAGSVSKQFTAAAVLLLAREGKLSLDDPVRKYVPELPDYGKPLLIRHMLTHTSGLRDWGSVAAIAGWPRSKRAYTHAHVLDIVSRQQSLNFPPGARWSYSNTGFNLAAIIVSRVSGMPFADFTRERLFTPLGMSDTSWRDDYTRIVKRRAMAYREQDGVFHTDMPFENVYGNGGLLTTVGDLLKWNRNFRTPIVGDAQFVAEQQAPGKFSDGRTHGYALGLFVGRHGGLREVYHSGSTAGYNAFLTRFPDQRLSVAVLCNVTTTATRFARDVADLYLAGQLQWSGPAAAYTPTDAESNRIAGLYRNVHTGGATAIVRGASGLRVPGAALTMTSATRFTVDEDRWELDGSGHAKVVDEFGTTDEFERVEPASPSAADLRRYEGRYISDDAEVEMRAVVEGNRLVLKRRPDATIPLLPLYADAFRGETLGGVIFRRDASGRVVEFSIVQDRVWNMPFRRIGDASSSTSAGRPQ